MAKIKFGMMMTDARGKLGGQVFSKNRSGAYVRTKVTPVNPRTVYQQVNRSLLGNISSSWSGLTRLQIEAWNNAVDAWQKTNIFGDLAKPTGKNLFTNLNKVRLSSFPLLSIQVTPPPKFEFAPIVLTDGVYLQSSATIVLGVTGAVVGTQRFQVRATPPVSNGTSYVANLLRVLPDVYPADETNIVRVAGGYSDRFGSVTVGSKIFVEIREIAENGQLGVPSIVSIIVT